MKPGNPKGNQPWTFIGRTDAEAEAILWPPDVKSWLFGKDPDPGKDWGKEERGNRGWDGGMASLTQWIWVWANSGRWWRTGKPGVLQSMGLQRVGHDWETKQYQQILTCGNWYIYLVHKQRWIWDHIIQRKWGIIWWFFNPLSPHHCCPRGLKYSWMDSFWTLEKNKIMDLFKIEIKSYPPLDCQGLPQGLTCRMHSIIISWWNIYQV